MAARRVLVTGAAGFVGAVLARRLLADGHRVALAVRPASDLWRLEELRGDAELFAVDLRHRDAVDGLLRDAAPDWVFDLSAHGAYSWQDSLPTMLDVNVGGVANVVEASITAGVAAIVHAGSSSEYGFMDHAPSEDELPDPNSAYAVTKASATLYCRWVARHRDQAITTLRLYSAYGPWEASGRLVPTLVAAALAGELPPLADPSIARDFVYVDDIVDAFLLAAQRAQQGAGAIYNLGTGTQTTLRELVETARSVLGVARKPAWGGFPARGWDTSVWVADPARIRAELGWAPRHDVAGGLAATADWMRAEPSRAKRYRPASENDA